MERVKQQNKEIKGKNWFIIILKSINFDRYQLK